MTGLIGTFGDAGAQQQPQTGAPNPYLMGTEGYEKGPRGLEPQEEKQDLVAFLRAL